MVRPGSGVKKKILFEEYEYVNDHLDDFFDQLSLWLGRWCRRRKYSREFFYDVTIGTGILVLESMKRHPNGTPMLYWRSALDRSVRKLTMQKEVPSEKLDKLSETSHCMGEFTLIASSGESELIFDAIKSNKSLEPAGAFIQQELFRSPRDGRPNDGK